MDNLAMTSAIDITQLQNEETSASPVEFFTSVWSDMAGNISAGETPEMTQVQHINHVKDMLITYITPVILITGTVGNTLSLIVLSRPKMRSKSVYFYLLLLAVADTAVLFMSAFRTWFRTVFGWELYLHHSDAVCKIHQFVYGVTHHMSAWLVVLVTLDRYLAVTFPLRVASFCTSRRAALTSGTCLLFLCIYQLHAFWTFKLRDYRPIHDIYCIHIESHFMKNGYFYINWLTYSLLPFIVVTTLNLKIVVRMKRRDIPADRGSSGERREIMRMNRTTSADSERDIARMTSVLYLVSLTWLFLTLPYSVIAVIKKPQGAVAIANYDLIKVFCFFAMWTNHAINFFLYCLSGKKLRLIISDSFRRPDMASLLRKSTMFTEVSARRIFDLGQGREGGNNAANV